MLFGHQDFFKKGYRSVLLINTTCTALISDTQRYCQSMLFDDLLNTSVLKSQIELDTYSQSD